MKPGENSNRGNGITVCKTLQEVKALVCNGSMEDFGQGDEPGGK